MPVMTLRAVGCGMGHKDFPRANCLRAMLGDTAADIGDVYELACNLDDMTGEDIAFAMERLLEAGALDVYTVPIGMKKSRPGVMLCVLCREEQREEMARLLLRHTTTLGVRESRHRRYTLSRAEETVDTPWGLWPGSCLRAGASGGRSRNMRTWPVLPGNRTCPWTRSVSRSGKQKASPMASHEGGFRYFSTASASCRKNDTNCRAARETYPSLAGGCPCAGPPAASAVRHGPGTTCAAAADEAAH